MTGEGAAVAALFSSCRTLGRAARIEGGCNGGSVAPSLAQAVMSADGEAVRGKT
jgi:hypothetical protein